MSIEAGIVVGTGMTGKVRKRRTEMQGKVRMRVNSTEELEIKRICSSILMSVIACSGCL